MKIYIKKSTIYLLSTLIVILSISTIYLSIEKYNQSKFYKLNKSIVCTTQKKLCAHVEYKYTDALLANVDVRAGNFYYSDEKKNKYIIYWENWLNDKKKEKIYDDSSFIIENFIPSVNDEKGKLFIRFEDKDGFVIEQITIDFKKINIDKETDRIETANIVNNYGIQVGRVYTFKKKITLENYKMITHIGPSWQSLSDFLN